MPKPTKSHDLARNLLKPGFPFSLRDKQNKRLKVHRKIRENHCVNLLPQLERAYQLCLDGKNERAANLISDIAGLLIATEINLGSEFLIEIEVRKAMPRLLSQIRRELKQNIPLVVNPQPKIGE
jgi:hypothetical protein